MLTLFGSGIWTYGTIIVALILLVLSYLRIGVKDRKEQGLVILYLAAGLVLFFVEGLNLFAILALEIGILAFNGLLTGRTSRRRGTYVTLTLLYVALIHWVGFVAIAQALLIGLLSVVTKIKQYRNNIENRKIEVRRDMVHMAAGILLMAIFYFEGESLAITLQILMILGGIFVITTTEKYKGKGIYSFISNLERNGSALGHGALWLALGSLFAVSFLGTPGVLAVFAAIFIGDPVATIVGMQGGSMKLPYNRRKSLTGSLAYFAVTAVLAYPFIGVYAILIGAVGAFVESLKIKIDDNFSVSVVLTLLLVALGI